MLLFAVSIIFQTLTSKYYKPNSFIKVSTNKVFLRKKFEEKLLCSFCRNIDKPKLLKRSGVVIKKKQHPDSMKRDRKKTLERHPSSAAPGGAGRTTKARQGKQPARTVVKGPIDWTPQQKSRKKIRHRKPKKC